MQNLFPIVLVLLAIFIAAGIAVVAWDLTSDKYDAPASDGDPQDPH